MFKNTEQLKAKGLTPMNPSPITVEALLVLDAIDSRGSFAAAAEQLNKVPSAISYIVQKLEEQLAVTLFVRQGRRSVLTPAGQHLLEEGRKLLHAVTRLSEQTKTISHGWEPKIRIAFDSIFDVETLFPPLMEFLSSHPNIEIDLSEEVMGGSWEALIEDRVDLLIGAPGPTPSHQGLRTQIIKQLEQVFVVPKGHELTKFSESISRDDIANYRTVVVHDSAKNSVHRSSNIIEKSQHFYVTSVSHKINAILAGIGVGVLPTNRIQEYLDSGELVAINLEGIIVPVDLYMSWKMVNKGKGLQNLKEIINNHLLI